jgi:RHS repeat-associated protein
MDTNGLGMTIFQPLLFAGQYQDSETVSYQNDGVTIHRPGLTLNGFRTYDPFTGSYLQVDPLLDSTWSTYVYVAGNPVGKEDPTGLEWDGGPEDDEGEVIVIEGDDPVVVEPGWFVNDPYGPNVRPPPGVGGSGGTSGGTGDPNPSSRPKRPRPRRPFCPPNRVCGGTIGEECKAC